MGLVWEIMWDPRAEKNLKKLDHAAQKRILQYLETRIATNQDPRRFGEALLGDKKGLWKYRVETYRMVCRIDDEAITVLVIDVGHRKNVYH